MARLDGTKDYPLKVAAVVDEVKKKYDAWLKDQDRVINDAMAKAQPKKVKGAKPAYPRATNTIMYVTWIADTQKLQVRFLTRIFEDVFQDERDNIDPGSKDGRKRPWDLCRKVSNIGARCQDALAIVSRRPLRRVHRIFSRHLTMVHDLLYSPND
jgi:hypothetical protein